MTTPPRWHMSPIVIPVQTVVGLDGDVAAAAVLVTAVNLAVYGPQRRQADGRALVTLDVLREGTGMCVHGVLAAMATLVAKGLAERCGDGSQRWLLSGDVA